MHSREREMLFDVIPEFDTGWGCFVWWGKAGLAANGETTERWGAASFLGTCPCRQRVCTILAAPVERLRPDDRDGRSRRLAALLAPYGVAAADCLADLPGDGEPLFLWRMSDVRAPAWTKGRVALVGDAAAAFLPAAGIRASRHWSRLPCWPMSCLGPIALPAGRARVVRQAPPQTSRSSAEPVAPARPTGIHRVAAAGLAQKPALRLVSMEQMVGPLIQSLHRPI